MKVEKIVEDIINKCEELDIIFIWKNTGKLSSVEKFINILIKAYTKDIEIWEAAGYKSNSNFSQMFNQIVYMKDKPKVVFWKIFFLRIIGYKQCKSCKSIKLLEEFSEDKTAKNGKVSLCKECRNKKSKYNRIDVKIHILTKYFNTECSICGYNKNISALELHHINNDIIRPEYAKNSKPGSYIFNCSVQTAEKRTIIEKENLIVLCSCCHQKEHAKEGQSPTDIIDSLEYLGYEYKCDVCDENTHLHLHHNNKDKKFTFSYFRGQSKQRILFDKLLEEEMNKDVVILCANHHREIHNQEHNNRGRKR